MGAVREPDHSINFMKAESISTEPGYNQQMTAKLLRLYGRSISKFEAERQHLTSELNDNVIQTLLALHIRLSALSTGSLEQMQAQLAEALTLTASLVDELRLTARSLRPLELDTLGLDAALRQVCEEFSDQAKFVVIYRGEDLPALPEAASLAFYRLTQEALANIQAHAGAAQVHVRLWLEGEVVKLEVSDAGRGFPASSEITDPLDAPGLSLFGLMIRFQQLNGRVTIQSKTGQGTTVTGEIPLAG